MPVNLLGGNRKNKTPDPLHLFALVTVASALSKKPTFALNLGYMPANVWFIINLVFCSLHSEGALLLSRASFLSVVILKLPNLKMESYSAGNGIGESILTETQICDWSVISLSLCSLQLVCVCTYIHTYIFMYYLCIYIILCLTSSGHVLPFIPTDSWPWSQSKFSASSPNTPDIYHLYWTCVFSTGSFSPSSLWRLLVSSQPRDHWTLGPSIAPSILVQYFFSWDSCHLLKDASVCLLSLMLSSAYFHAPPLFRWLPSLTLSVLNFHASHHLRICPPASSEQCVLLRSLTSSTSIHVSQVSLASCHHRELLLSSAWGFPRQNLTHWGSEVFQLSCFHCAQSPNSFSSLFFKYSFHEYFLSHFH